MDVALVPSRRFSPRPASNPKMTKTMSTIIPTAIAGAELTIRSKNCENVSCKDVMSYLFYR